MKRLTISVSDWVYNTYLSNFSGNRSRYIEEYFIKGFELTIGDKDILKQKVITLQKLNVELENTIKELKGKLNLQQKNIDKVMHNPKYDPDLIRRKRFYHGVKNAGVLARL